uniref:Uncharacterized protein n=1 Tax=Knipowitschia caucasica TaxID=637954 RepID=A0AAV2ISY4_KNICA
MLWSNCQPGILLTSHGLKTCSHGLHRSPLETYTMRIRIRLVVGGRQFFAFASPQLQTGDSPEKTCCMMKMIVVMKMGWGALCSSWP